MKIHLRFFASLREALGPQAELVLPEGASVGAAREALRAQGEPFVSALAPGRALRAALNQSLSDETTALKDGDELAFFPPVTGG